MPHRIPSRRNQSHLTTDCWFVAEGPFDNVRWSLTTHNHSDHHDPAAVGSFLNNSPATEFILPTQALITLSAGLAAEPRILDIQPAFQTESVILESPGIKIEVFNMEHFDQFGNDFSAVSNFGFLVTMGGAKLLHLGDVDYIPENFAAFDFASRGIDAVVLPTFNTLISARNRDLIAEQIAPRQIIGATCALGNSPPKRRTS